MLEIHRTPGSEQCPDVEGVFGAITRMFPERAIRQAADSAHAAARASVRIRPTVGGHEAVVTVSLPRAGERVIVDDEPNCAGLADALAVCLVMLMDLEAQPNDASPAPQPRRTATCETPECRAPRRQNQKKVSKLPGVTVTTPPSPRTTTRSVDGNASRKPRWRTDASAGAVGGVGLLKPPGLGVALGLELFYRERWGIALQGLRFWTERIESQGGSLTFTLWGGMTDFCFRQRVGGASAVDGCLRLGLGSQTAEAQGYATNLEPRALWLVTGPSARVLHRFTNSFGGFVGLGLLGHLRPQKFSVGKGEGAAGRETVAEAATLGFVATVGLSFGG